MTQDKAKGYCPQCGAEVDLDVGDPLMQCEFCRTKLYMKPRDGFFSYILPPFSKFKDLDSIVFLPYWRFKGFRFCLTREGSIKTTHVDSTLPAAKELLRLPSLGVAARVASMHLNTGRVPGLKSLAPPATFLKRLNSMIEEGLRDHPISSFILGQIISIILAPFQVIEGAEEGDMIGIRPVWRQGGGITKVKHEYIKPFLEQENQQENFKKKEPIDFLPLICPECGSDLPAISMASVPFCKYCGRLWPLKTQSFIPQRAHVLSHEVVPQLKFIPFYHFSVVLKGFPFDNRLDLLRRLFSYKRFPDTLSEEPIQLVVPAFRINPSLFLRLGKKMSSSDLPFLASEDSINSPMSLACGIDLSLDSALQSLPLLLLAIIGKRKKMLDEVKKAAVKIVSIRVIFIPFQLKGRELIEPRTGQAIPEAAIRYGKNL